MNKLVEKVIKLCDKICEDNYPITNLNIYSHYNVGFTINGISIYILEQIIQKYIHVKVYYVQILIQQKTLVQLLQLKK